jgi:hypothetical protein
MRISERNLYRISLAVLTFVLALLACRHYATVRDLKETRELLQTKVEYLRNAEPEGGAVTARSADSSELWEVHRRYSSSAPLGEAPRVEIRVQTFETAEPGQQILRETR